MSLLSLHFRSLANRLNISDFTASDLKLEKVAPIIKTSFNEKLERAIALGEIDLDEPSDVWELLYIDSIIKLENFEGKSIRVGVALRSREHQAYRIYAQVQKPTFQSILQQLKIERFWIFAISDFKHYFPRREQWIDLLYEQIDLPANACGCKLIDLG
jgi:hypothetical protein